MSGKPKHPVTEAEQLRQLAREAHEAIQGLREAIREARSLEASQVDQLRLNLNEATKAGVGKLAAVIQGANDDLQATVNECIATMRKMLGDAGSSDVVMERLIEKLSDEIKPQIQRALREGGVVASGRRAAARRHGPVYVTNDPALVPPDVDLVIDARDSGARAAASSLKHETGG